MGFGRWLLLSGVCLALAIEKSLFAVRWQGSLTKLDETGTTAYSGLVTRVQCHNQFAYMCIPRLKPNSMATLVRMRIPDAPSNDIENPDIERYPLSTPQTEGECNLLQSAVDLYLDKFKILWVLDVGSIKYDRSKPVGRCYPKVLGINVETGQIEHVINLENVIEPVSRVQFITADYDVDGKCYLYISDAETMSIIVWDVMNKTGHRVMLPKDAISANDPKDVLYLALVKHSKGSRLYYTYYSSNKMYFIDTKYILTEASLAKSSMLEPKPSNLILLGTDGLNSIFFRYEVNTDVYKWNIDTPFTKEHFELVHTGGQLMPTHAIPCMAWNVMMLCESNLSEYLNPNLKQMNSFNSLTVMQVAQSY